MCFHLNTGFDETNKSQRKNSEEKHLKESETNAFYHRWPNKDSGSTEPEV
jgi:rhamnogalacturonyl hydrolase YesR